MTTIRLALAAILLTACGADPGGPTEGPALGVWTLSEDTPWECSRPATGDDCTAPAPFTSEPLDVAVRGGGVIAWTTAAGTAEHQGSADGLCITVPTATEHAHRRDLYTFCLAHDAMGNVLPDLAGAHLRWDTGTADECGCLALFDYAGPE